MQLSQVKEIASLNVQRDKHSFSSDMQKSKKSNDLVV